MDSVGVSIDRKIEILHNHDTTNADHHAYTLKCKKQV